jgi:hypothetical protein
LQVLLFERGRSGRGTGSQVVACLQTVK